MASIVGEKPYHNADGWSVTDKIFGYLDRAGTIYNKIRYPQPGEINYDAAAEQARIQAAGIFGLPKPMGAVILFGIIGLVGFGIYKIVK
jgi:hypothetical protein